MKATLVLLPLLGITYMLFFVNPGEDEVSRVVFIYFNSFLESFQVPTLPPASAGFRVGASTGLPHPGKPNSVSNRGSSCLSGGVADPAYLRIITLCDRYAATTPVPISQAGKLRLRGHWPNITQGEGNRRAGLLDSAPRQIHIPGTQGLPKLAETRAFIWGAPPLLSGRSSSHPHPWSLI